MLKPAASPAVEAVTRVAAVKAVALQGDAPGEASYALAQLVKGRLYNAQVIAALPDGSLKVAIEGRQIDLSLGQIFTAGQAVILKYLGDEPTPAFMLMPNAEETAASASLSPTARLIDAHLRSAQEKGAGPVYEASIPATATPQDAMQFAADLRHALASSGLFYESHLAEFSEGLRPLASLMQEPQNQGDPFPSHLLAQQLSVLETQRVLWHGEIWSGQLADWRIETEERSSGGDAGERPEPPAVASSLTLHLPRLGKITARLKLADGRLNLSLLTARPTTAAELGSHAESLMNALQPHVGVLEGFSITHEDRHG